MRRLLILALLASVAFAAYPNLQLAYRFQNSALDWSGNGRNGTVKGSGVYTTARGQQALYFEGNDYVATPSFGLSGTVVVFAAWVRCKAFTNYQLILGEATVSTTIGYLACVRNLNTNNLWWEYADGTSRQYPTAVGYFNSPFDDAWLHMTIVCDYAGKNVYFYRNGILFYSVGMVGTPRFPSTNRAKYVGAFWTVSLPYYLTDGYLANVQLWTLATMPPLAQMTANANRLMLGMNPIW